jgi:adenylate cyclase
MQRTKASGEILDIVVGLLLVVTAIAAFFIPLALGVSWPIAVAAFVAFLALVVLVGVPLLYNRLGPWYDGRRRERDDSYFFNGCWSGKTARHRWMNRRLPNDPRCRLCLVPFGGVGRITRVQPSRKNPNFCMACFETAPLGGSDMEVGVLFADIRGFTSWCEGRAPEEVERVLNRFYAVSASVLAERDAIIDKMVGDEVMALFLPAFPSLREKACDVMVQSAGEILRRLGAGEQMLPIGVGVNFGVARVGNVGDGSVKDFTAVGDVVNTAARLQGCAQPGQIVMSDAVYERLGDQYPGATPLSITVKGKADSVPVHVLAAHP